MTWFAFAGYNGGKAIDLAGVQEKIAVSWGFHGYGTEAQAEAQPNSVNLVQKVEVDALIADYKAAVSGGEQPGGPNASNLLKGASQADTNAAKNAAKSVIGAGWNLTFGNTTGLLSRILKVVIGGVLLLAGILKLSGTDKTLEAVVPIVGGPAGRLLKA